MKNFFPRLLSSWRKINKFQFECLKNLFFFFQSFLVCMVRNKRKKKNHNIQSIIIIIVIPIQISINLNAWYIVIYFPQNKYMLWVTYAQTEKAPPNSKLLYYKWREMEKWKARRKRRNTCLQLVKCIIHHIIVYWETKTYGSQINFLPYFASPSSTPDSPPQNQHHDCKAKQTEFLGICVHKKSKFFVFPLNSEQNNINI